ncbi:MAG: single-stranded DNA-binding protein [Inoviridae sp.]|nr:MAG: single-stranded DNA-binding protein [Inoviridae sp.]
MKMNKLRMTLTGDSARTLQSKRTGNDFKILDVYVHGSAPYPEKIAIFEDPKLPRGVYDVPVRFEVQNSRLEVRYDFKNAAVVESK